MVWLCSVKEYPHLHTYHRTSSTKQSALLNIIEHFGNFELNLDFGLAKFTENLKKWSKKLFTKWKCQLKKIYNNSHFGKTDRCGLTKSPSNWLKKKSRMFFKNRKRMIHFVHYQGQHNESSKYFTSIHET